jgi:glycine cleavage system H protein
MNGFQNLLPLSFEWVLPILHKRHWELPKIGDAVIADKVWGEVESTKSVSEIFSPVSGKVVAVNDGLNQSPELLNSDPYGAGWLADIEVSETPTPLLSAEQYRQITA